MATYVHIDGYDSSDKRRGLTVRFNQLFEFFDFEFDSSIAPNSSFRVLKDDKIINSNNPKL